MAQQDVVIVTGASGFIGSALIDRLAGRYALVGFDRAASGEPPMADSDHLVGSLVVAISIIAMAEVARPLRFLNTLAVSGSSLHPGCWRAARWWPTRLAPSRAWLSSFSACVAALRARTITGPGTGLSFEGLS